MTTFNVIFESSEDSFAVGFEGVTQVPKVDPYEGAYTFTPSATAQTIEIQGKTALEDITINPIPNNYGLITWDGQTITVS